MEKTKQKLKENNNNGEKTKFSKDEMIAKLVKEIKELEVTYHQKTGALAYLREID